MNHELKTWPAYFQAVWDRRKLFEIRKNDRGFQTGDDVRMNEWDPERRFWTGRFITGKIIYICQSAEFGIAPGYCVFGLAELENKTNVQRLCP